MSVESNSIIQRILDKTNAGLDIILRLVPHASNCVNNKRKFKLNDAEKTPSAILSLYKNVYLVKDFGSTGFSGNAIQLYIYLENVDLKTAIKRLATQYNCFEEGVVVVEAKPKKEYRPATELEEEKSYHFEYRAELTEDELEVVFAREVIYQTIHFHKDNWKQKLNTVCASYGFFALISYTYISNGKAIITHSTPEYPIFVIKCDTFNKIYQPKSADKGFRFLHSGVKSDKYIFGYKRLQKTFADEELKHNEGKDEDAKPGKPFKLDKLIIGSGDRDSLNIAALGYHVIWKNSEKEPIIWDTWIQLRKMVDSIYQINDIDTTGLEVSHETAMHYIELKTIYLPMELRERKDWRGNECKDVRDYLHYYPAKKFDRLVDEALEYKFWDEEPMYNKNGEFKKAIYQFNNVRAYNFIMKCGFWRYPIKTARNGFVFIKIDKNIVKVIETSDIKDFVNEFLEQRYFTELTLRNTFLRTPQLKEESLINLKHIEIDFKYYDRDYQYLFFENKTWKVTANEILEFKAGDVKKMVWENRVIKKRVKKLDAPFTIIQNKLPNGDIDLDIKINTQDCLFLNFMINTSRIHWRNELENYCEETFKTQAEQENYRKENRFNIEGALLSDLEKKEQKRHLINKVYVLGYILCRQKFQDKAWAPFFMDHKIGAEGQSNGGSGKSILMRSVEPFKGYLQIDGKTIDSKDDKHTFEEVTDQTEFVGIDDLDQYAQLEPYFSKITGDFTVNPKWANRVTFPFEDSPKIGFTTNYSVRNNNSSIERRLLYSATSDYYHDNQTGTYREDRTPKDDFGKMLITDFNDEEYNQYINTMACCLQAFMKIPYKVNPPMDNVQKRNLMGVMGDAFLSWADVYFSVETKRLDVFVVRTEAFADFQKVSNNRNFSTQRFTTCIEAWCRYYSYEYNPKSLRNEQNRIIRREYKRRDDGSIVMSKKNVGGVLTDGLYKVPQEMIFIKTKDVELHASLFTDIEEADATAGIHVGSPDKDDMPY